MDKKQNKEIIVIATAIVIIVLGAVYLFWDAFTSGKGRGLVVSPAQEEQVIEQLKELEALRNQAPVPPKTPEEQGKELNALYKKSGIKTPSSAETSEQLREFEKLRNPQ